MSVVSGGSIDDDRGSVMSGISEKSANDFTGVRAGGEERRGGEEGEQTSSNIFMQTLHKVNRTHDYQVSFFCLKFRISSKPALPLPAALGHEYCYLVTFSPPHDLITYTTL
jgi:hypothetical protein